MDQHHSALTVLARRPCEVNGRLASSIGQTLGAGLRSSSSITPR